MDNYRLYITIVEQGSFSKAAEKLGITQPTVSKQIDRLEEKLSSQLFKRSTRKLILTAAGERYYERAKEIDALVKATEHEIRHISIQDDSVLRIATSPALAAQILPPVLEKLSRKHPEARFHLLVEDTTPSGYYQRHFELEYDLFIREGEGAESNMSARPLGDIPIGFYASPEYLKEHGTPTCLADIGKGHRCMGTRVNRSNPWIEKTVGDLPLETWDWELTSNEGACLVAYAEADMGILFLSDHLVHDALERRTLVKLDIEEELHHMPVTALYRREYLTPMARECLDLLIEHMDVEYPRKMGPLSSS
ncbi:MAG: LysR family transcriptional regulator [Pseudomonadales bacterium]